MTSKVSAVEEARPNTMEIASPWKIGSARMNTAPIIAAAAVRKIGLKRIAPASSTACCIGTPSATRWRMKSTSRMELRTMMPASAMKPIIEVAVKAAFSHQ